MSSDLDQWKVPTEYPPAEVRVRFGQLDNQTMPLSWAEEFLRIVYTKHPGVFRTVLPQCAGLAPEMPKPGRKASNA